MARPGAPFLSDAWYRIAEVRCWLRPGLRVVPMRFRGRPWVALQDPGNGRVHRLSAQAWAWLAALDAETTLDTAWRRAIQAQPERAPSQSELIDLLAELFVADLLQSDRPADVAALLERRQRQRKPLWLQNLLNPLSVRLPLVNPDPWLGRLHRVLRPWIGLPAWALWLAVVLPAAVLAASHTQEITANLADRLLSPAQWLLLLPLLFLLKLVHELAHGVMLRHGGGRSTELGIMFLVLMPVPYIDATATNAMPSKWTRAAVGLAGMWIELLLCAGAVLAWLLLEPGPVRSAMHQVILATGLATLLFNANPLLRFDGYYVLVDLIEIPNLASRSNALWIAWLRRRLLGDADHALPDVPADEWAWTVAYAPLSLAYRLALTLGIALFVAEAYPLVGAALALLSVTLSVVWPLLKGLAFVAGDPALGRRRGAAAGRLALALGGLLAGLMLVPAPRAVVAEGVLWAQPDAELRAGEDGQVAAVPVRHGQVVPAGTLVAAIRSPELQADRDAQAARVAALDIKLQHERQGERLRAAQTEADLQREQAALATLDQRSAALQTRSARAGEVQWMRASDLPGQPVSRGDLLGLVDDGGRPRVRAVLGQDDVALVRTSLRAVQVVLADAPGQPMAATVQRAVAGGEQRLPSRALALDAGGSWATDPADADGLATLQRVFELDLLLPERPPHSRLGMRAWVKFQLSPEPLGWQAWRRLRQLFLARLAV